MDWKDMKIEGVSMYESPSPVVDWDGTLYCFYQNAETNGTLQWSRLASTGVWETDSPHPETAISASPSGVVFRDEMYVFYRSPGNSLMYKHFKRGTGVWEEDMVINTGVSSSPSAVVYRDKLYIFHHGGSGDNRLWYNVTSNGKAWDGDKPVPNATLTASPSAVVYKNKIFVFYQGAENAGTLCWSELDGTNWTNPQQAEHHIPAYPVIDSPAAVVTGANAENVRVFYQSNDHDGNHGIPWFRQLTVVDFPSGPSASWSSGIQIPDVGMSKSPGVAVLKNNVFTFHQGGGFNGQLWYFTIGS